MGYMLTLPAPSSLWLREHCRRGVKNGEEQDGEERYEMLFSGHDMAKNSHMLWLLTGNQAS